MPFGCMTFDACGSWKHLESQEDLEVERFIMAHERFKSGDGRVYARFADEEDYGDEYLVYSVSIH